MTLVYVLTTSSRIKRKRLVGPPRQASQPPLGEKRTNDLITVRLGGNLLSPFKKKKKKERCRCRSGARGENARGVARRGDHTDCQKPRTAIVPKLQLFAPLFEAMVGRQVSPVRESERSLSLLALCPGSGSFRVPSPLLHAGSGPALAASSTPGSPWVAHLGPPWPRLASLLSSAGPGRWLVPDLEAARTAEAHGHEKRAQTSAIRSHALEAQIEL